MNKIRRPIFITMLVALLIGSAAFAFSTSPVFAQTTTPPTPAPQNSAPTGKTGPVVTRLEKLYQNEIKTLKSQAVVLKKANQWVARVEVLISKWQMNGVDTSKFEAALQTFQDKLSNAQIAHDKAADILQKHAGFNTQGKVTDRAEAIQTVKDANRALKDARTTLANGRKELVDFIKTWREEHRPVKTTS